MDFGKQMRRVLSKEISFETFTPIWSYVNESEKQFLKIQNLKFHNSLNKFGRDHHKEYAWIFGSESVTYFQRICRLIFLLYGPKIRKKSKCYKMLKTKQKQSSGNMVERYHTTKYLVAIYLPVSEKTGFTDGRMDNGGLSDDSSSAVQ